MTILEQNAVKEYVILTAPASEKLTKFVNNHISTGWQPLGGASVTTSVIIKPEGTVVVFDYCQAMVKY